MWLLCLQHGAGAVRISGVAGLDLVLGFWDFWPKPADMNENIN